MKVALIHDWLTGMRGGEKVLEVFCRLFPDATVFTLLHNKGSVSPVIEKMKIKSSFAQYLPGVSDHYRSYLPLFPAAIESFNLKGFDMILSSSHCVAKGVKVPKGVAHFAFCHTPMRYMWVFFDQYFGSYPRWQQGAIRLIGEGLKKWDRKSSGSVTEFIAISQTIKDRIRAVYDRDSVIINPPVDVNKFTFNPKADKEEYYLCVSALVPYKRIDVIVDAFNELKDKKVVIIGYGNIRKELEKRRISDNIKFLGWVDDKELAELYQRARAFIYVAEEDFGIAPVEAQAAGLPVIAYGKGGVAETVIPLSGRLKGASPTGLFFDTQDKGSLVKAINEFEKMENVFDPVKIRNHALNFSEVNFIENMKSFLSKRLGRQNYGC
jgi:glycosyltransferase involved in cell wall biosynthesis